MRARLNWRWKYSTLESASADVLLLRWSDNLPYMRMLFDIPWLADMERSSEASPLPVPISMNFDVLEPTCIITLSFRKLLFRQRHHILRVMGTQESPPLN